MKKAIDFFTAHPARFFLLAALLWGGFMCLISIIRGKFDLDGLLVEANGMVFDLLVFGVLLSIYEALREKRDKIERLHEEIDDYRGWDEKEATYRIVGAIRRLNDLEISEIDLSRCFLQSANLWKRDLRGAKLDWAKLQFAILYKAKLREANLLRSNLQGARLFDADLTNAKFERAQLQDTDLRNTNLQGANFKSANLERVKLHGAIVDEDWFKKLAIWNVAGREEIIANYIINASCDPRPRGAKYL